MAGLGKTDRRQGLGAGKCLLVSRKQSKRDPFSALLQGAQPSYETSESLPQRRRAVGGPVLLLGRGGILPAGVLMWRWVEQPSCLPCPDHLHPPAPWD